MKFSIVTTLYRSEHYIAEFYRRMTAVVQQVAGENYEIIFVNDGSPDHSLQRVIKISEKDTHVLVLDLSRNFGHHKAMMAGLSYTSGDKIFLIDCDLEEDPEYLLEFEARMEKEVCDVVYGRQSYRKGDVVERYSGKLFYWLFNRLTRLNLPSNLVTARLMTRQYVDALLQFEERELMIAGVFCIVGFNQVGHSVKKHRTSKTTYTFRKKMAILVTSVTSFSSAPLVAIFCSGLIIFFFASAYSAYLIVSRLFFTQQVVDGWTSVVVSVWLLGGLIISFMGVIGMYVAKIYSETKRRPNYIVRQSYGQKNRSK